MSANNLAGFNDLLFAAKSTADSVNTATTVRATRPIPRLGDDIYVQCEFATAAATCAITVLLYDDDLAASASTANVLIGVALPGTQTATAGSYRVSAAGAYRAPILVFVGGNAKAYEVRMAATSGGNVEIRAWTTS
jgi:hypothetical protein